jgi:hypothetical protein
MIDEYTKLTQEQSILAESILFPLIVCDENGYKNGFDERTQFCINPANYERAYAIEEWLREAINSNQILTELFSSRVTREVARESGWLPQPINLVA